MDSTDLLPCVNPPRVKITRKGLVALRIVVLYKHYGNTILYFDVSELKSALWSGVPSPDWLKQGIPGTTDQIAKALEDCKEDGLILKHPHAVNRGDTFVLDDQILDTYEEYLELIDNTCIITGVVE